jgi:ABC-type transporter lipoprotein component MlaA/pimeloyl-ACP methyl ester carboxylesterase
MNWLKRQVISSFARLDKDHKRTQPLRAETARGPFFLMLAVVLFICPIVCSQGQTNQIQNRSGTIILPASVPDPAEPFNRVMWRFNQGFMQHFVRPTSKVYRFVVRKPVRKGINNFARNLTYPGRAINNALESRWTGARDESYRFFCNTTVGVAGIFDVATRWNIPKADADFGQTFGVWGWDPRCYLMLPFLGPSNERDAAGFAADTLANPLSYVTPYRFQFRDPFTYLSPYTYFSIGAIYNGLSDSVDDYVRFSKSEMDAYSILQYSWTFARNPRPPDFQPNGAADVPSLETLQAAFNTPKNPEFARHAKTGSVRIPGTGRKLPYTYWMQSSNAPIVYIAPGLGSHRLSSPVLALAELAYTNGFSAVCVSSTFNYEFMEYASSSALPAYIPVDARDLHVALTAIDKQLGKKFPDRIGSRALMGYSMGAFESLYLAGTESTNREPLIKFDRYVAIDSPVRLLHGISRLDDFFNAPLEWPTERRTGNIENTFLKVAALTKNPGMPLTSLNLSAVESKFLIGMTFRLILRDAIYTSQERTNLGVLYRSVRGLRREPVYREIMKYSYRDYLRTFLVPYYQGRGVELSAPDALEKASDLRTYGTELQSNPKVRVIINQNDFLLAPEDLEWLQSSFSDGRLKVFDHGGHLGNMTEPAVEEAIVRALKP